MSDIPVDKYAIIIGSMKCGTTSLYEYLVEHPQICPAAVKEPEYFSRFQGNAVKLENYTDLWDFNPAQHRYALEASVGYSKFPTEPDVAERIFKFGILPKFIYIIRNPFDRIESHYNFMVQLDRNFSYDLMDDHLINVSNYYLQLEQYRRFFPKESILLLDFDELKVSPHKTLSRIYGYLGIDQTFFPETYPQANKTKPLSRAELILLRSPVGPLSQKLFPKPVNDWGRKVLNRLSRSAERYLSEDDREKVRGLLSDEMLRLEREYGFDVRRWGFGV